MLIKKYYFGVFGFILLIQSCSQNNTTNNNITNEKPASISQDQTKDQPTWISKRPENHSVGSFSFSFHSIEKAKKFAIELAKNKYLSAKIKQRVVSGNSSLEINYTEENENSTLKTRIDENVVTEVIPDQTPTSTFSVKEYWIDEAKKIVWVLIQED